MTQKDGMGREERGGFRGKALVGRILKMQRVQSPPGDQGRGGLILMVIFLCSTQPDPKISRGHGRF